MLSYLLLLFIECIIFDYLVVIFSILKRSYVDKNSHILLIYFPLNCDTRAAIIFNAK